MGACRPRIPGTVRMAVLVMLLGWAAPAPGQIDREIEEEFWKSVECENTPKVQAYLETYPNGAYVAEARGCLEGQLGLDWAARMLVQQGLAAVGHDPGPVDALFGPATRQALQDWQAGKGFAATGYLTREQADTLITHGRERTQEASSQISPDQTCVGQSKGAECWMELANQAGCYVWNDNLQKDETVTWTGECSDGLAQGNGVLTSVYGEDQGEATDTGLLRSGKRHGHWVKREADGAVYEGPFVNGKRHGHWALRYADGAVYEGPAVEGRLHGRWTIRDADGNVSEVTYVNGEPQDQ